MFKKGLSVLLACILLMALSVTAFAASDVKIYNPNTKEYIFTVPGVIETKTYEANGGFYISSGDKVDVFTVNTGIKIDMSGLAAEWNLTEYDNSGGKLVYRKGFPDSKGIERSTESTGEGSSPTFEKGSYVQFNREGYFQLTLSKPGLMASGWHCFLHVVNDSGSTAADKTTKTTDKPADKTTAASAEEKPFELKTLQSVSATITKGLAGKTVYDTSLIKLNNQLVRLNRDIAAGKKIENEKDVKSALQAANKAIKAIDLKDSKIKLYEKKGAEAKKTTEEKAVTQKRLNSINNNLEKAMKHYGLK